MSGARAIAALVYRQQRRGALIWGSVFGVYVWVSAYGYEAAYPKAQDRTALIATLGSNKGVQAIFGPARSLETVSGFTAWRCATSFAAIGALWGLLLATKVLRGDEEAGRADLLFAGSVNRTTGLGGQLLGVGVTLGVLFVTVASWFVTVGLMGGYFSVRAALWFALVACMSAAMFAAVGAFTAQLAASRRVAAGLAGSLFGVALLVRAIAEATSTPWLRWATPLGWIDKTHPLTGTNIAPVLPVVLVVVVSCGGAAVLGVRRDLGAALGPSRDHATAKTRLLRSPVGLAVRLNRGVMIAWAVGLAIGAAVFGIVSSAVGDSFADNKSVADVFNRLGADISARGYVGVTFVIMATMLGYVAATFIGACRVEAAEGRLEYLAGGPVTRRTWLTGRVSVAASALVGFGLAIGVGGWAGVATSGGHIPFGAMVLAGLNVVAPGLVVLGFGACVFGFAPRAGVGAAYALVAWSFLVEMIGSLVQLNHFALDTSIVHHIAAAPAVDPRWAPNAVMVGFAITLTALGACAIQRRDVASG